jgi:flagellar hook-associated protein 3 FlgL
MERVTTLSQHTRLFSFIGDTQKRFDDLQTQVASGFKAQNYSGVAREAGRLISIESTHVKVTQYLESNTTVDRRLQMMESSVAQITDVMSNFKTLLVSALNAPNATEVDLNNQARQMLNQVTGLLNVKIDGRYLFSGGRTNVVPVDLSSLPVSYTVPTTDGASGAYYKGDSQILSARADDDLTVSYGILANGTEFERAIRALDVVVKGAPTDRTMLNHALDVANQALDGLPDVRTRIGLSRKTLETSNGKHNEYILFAEQIISDIENVDVAEAVTRINEAQTTLQASYLTVARLSQTSLLNYLT